MRKASPDPSGTSHPSSAIRWAAKSSAACIASCSALEDDVLLIDAS
jgi:hypothetical protein